MDIAHYRTAVDAAAIFTETDLAGNITYANAQFCAVSGYSLQELLGANHRLVNSGHHPPEFFDDLWHTIANGRVWRGDICNRNKNGELYWVSSTILPLLDPVTSLPLKYISIRFEVTEQRHLMQTLQFQAQHDVLTGLANRQLLHQRLNQALSGEAHLSRQVGVCLLDLDGFKAVNDRLGHHCGDTLLKRVAQRLTDAVRGHDLVARLGGDEFVILLTELRDRAEAQGIVERALAALARPYLIDDDTVELSASAGLTLYPQDDASADTLLRHADHALYQAKQSGRNRLHLFDVNENINTTAHYQMLASVTQALANDELVLYFQPKVNMRHGTVVGFEALLRWQHPRDGLVPPLSFLPLVEDSDLIIDIGEWVIERALTQLARWAKAGQVWPVSVNIAARHFHQANFVARLQTLLARHPSVPPQWLNIELLESVALEDIQQVSQTMAACNALGVSLSLDDFGTGYSSLSYLKRLPTKVLKIDRSFVRDILDDKDDLALTEAIIALSVVFSRDVVAEGVENAEQGVLLMRLGCDVGQGYGIARPMPADEVIAWVQHFQPDPKWATWAHVLWDLRNFPLLVAQHDHLHWVKRLMMAVDGANLALSTAELSDWHQCRFGLWYDGPGTQRYGHLAEFAAIAPVHAEVHRLGGEIMRWRDAGDLTQARVLCGRLLALKDQVLLLLSQLQGVVLTLH